MKIKINKNWYKKLWLNFNKKINKSLYKKLKSNNIKKIDKNLNKKLKPSFIYYNIHLRKIFFILIIKINSKIYKLKTYNKIIKSLIYNIRQ